MITKVGSEGAYVTTATEEYLVPGFKVDKVVDTVGGRRRFSGPGHYGIDGRPDAERSCP